MIRKVKYEARDGTFFDTKVDCKSYEKKGMIISTLNKFIFTNSKKYLQKNFSIAIIKGVAIDVIIHKNLYRDLAKFIYENKEIILAILKDNQGE